MSLLRRAADNVLRRSSVTGSGDPWAIPSNGSLATYTSSGIPVNEDTALQLLAVTACVRILAGALSGLKWDVLPADVDYGAPLRPQPSIVADPFGGMNRMTGFGQTRKAGLSSMMVSMLLRGNAYAAVLERDPETMHPSMLQVISPDAVDVDLDKKTGERLYKVNNRDFPNEAMLHIPGLSLPGQPTGLSVLSYAKRTIGLGIAAEEFGAKFFGDGAHLSGIIEIPGDLDKDRARQLKENFQANHGGLRHAHTVGVLTGGAKWAPVSISPEDAQFLGTRAAQTLDMAMLFGIPPHMLGQVDRTTSWGKGIEEQSLGFLKFTLDDWTQRFEDAWSAMVDPEWVVQFNYNNLLRPDTVNRFTSYQAARNAAIFTPDEIRAREGYAPLPDGKGADAFAPLNSAHATDPGWEPGQPEPVPAPEESKP